MPWIAGVDGCKRGWVAALLDLDNGDLTCLLVRRLADLLDGQLRPSLVAVDIPIGLPESGDRACDREARRLLTSRASTLFPAPLRSVLELDYPSANALTRQVNGKGLTRQSFALVGKVREVDVEVRARPPGLVREVHPELSFSAMNGGQPLSHSKRNSFGLRERRDLLAKVYGSHLVRLERQSASLRGAVRHDLYDALAALWTARRIARGEAHRLPDPAPVDSLGVAMRISC